MASIHQLTRLNDIATLRDSMNHSDLVIRCERRELHVHKAVLCSASKVLSKACDKKFEEGATGVVERTEFDADTVERMIEYIYKQTYHVDSPAPSTESSSLSSTESTPSSEDDTDGTEDDQAPSEPYNTAGKPSINTNTALIAHARAYAIGEYYELPTLQQLAMEKFEAEATSSWSINGFIDVIREVNAISGLEDRALRNKLRGVAMDHIDQLVDNDDFMTKLAELPDVQDFAADMLRATVRHQNDKFTKLDEKMRGFLQQLETAEPQIEQLMKRVTNLTAEVESNQHGADAVRTDARRAFHAFQKSIRELPSSCKNERCGREFGKLQFESAGHAGVSGLCSDWWVRCAKCKCHLKN
ncbi:hypothetical protein LTR78_007254 [Recurvomyces mirabilis]|uniref:BTB domain-containing protein n=1 Tax=Recurvomyces mirabilis TaxID=574656 RepID=A0AAE1BYN1_9PEZI|nr:hypothetical protein LTR78_007254 [Recurvomyces mirabilis]